MFNFEFNITKNLNSKWKIRNLEHLVKFKLLTIRPGYIKIFTAVFPKLPEEYRFGFNNVKAALFNNGVGFINIGYIKSDMVNMPVFLETNFGQYSFAGASGYSSMIISSRCIIMHVISAFAIELKGRFHHVSKTQLAVK